MTETVSIPWQKGKTVQENIESAFPAGLSIETTELIWNGLTINPLEFDLDFIPVLTDKLEIINYQEGFDPISLIISSVIAIAGALATYLLTPKPKIPNSVGEIKTSSNNSLTGQTNVARLYQAKPDIYGAIRCYPDLVKKATNEYIDNIKYVEQLMCVGLGDYKVTQLKYSETLLDKISGTTYKIYHPGDNIDIIRYQYASDEVDGQELTPPNLVPPPVKTQDFKGVDSLFFSNDILTLLLHQNADITYWNSLPLPIQVQFWIKERIVYWQGWNDRFVDVTAQYRGRITEIKMTNKSPSLVISGAYREFWINPPQNILRISQLNTQFVLSHVTGSQTEAFILPEKGTEIQLDFICPRGLRNEQGGYRQIDFDITYWRINDFGIEVDGTRTTVTMSIGANSYAQQNRSLKIKDLEFGKYVAMVFRKTNGYRTLSDQVKVENIFICSYEYNKKAIDTLVWVRTKATEQATSLKELKFNCIVNRKTISYDIQSKTLIRTSLTETRSFANAVLHEFVEVFGHNALELDLQGLFSINNKIQEETNALSYFDFSFDDKDISLGQRLETICNCCRVTIYRDGGIYRFVRDDENKIPVALINGNNTVNNETGGTVNKKIANKTAHNGIQLAYVNGSVDNISGTDKKEYINLTIESDGSVSEKEASMPIKLDLAGCRNAVQALDRAYLEAGKLLYFRTVVNDEVLDEGAYLNKGDVILWVDTWNNTVAQGEIIAKNDDTYQTSNDLLLSNDKKYSVSVTNRYGYPSAPVSLIQFSKNSFTTKELTDVYLANDKIQMGSLYAIYEEKSKEPVEYLITEKQFRDKKYVLTLTNYDRRVYSLYSSSSSNLVDNVVFFPSPIVFSPTRDVATAVYEIYPATAKEQLELQYSDTILPNSINHNPDTQSISVGKPQSTDYAEIRFQGLTSKNIVGILPITFQKYYTLKYQVIKKGAPAAMAFLNLFWIDVDNNQTLKTFYLSVGSSCDWDAPGIRPGYMTISYTDGTVKKDPADVDIIHPTPDENKIIESISFRLVTHECTEQDNTYIYVNRYQIIDQ